MWLLLLLAISLVWGTEAPEGGAMYPSTQKNNTWLCKHRVRLPPDNNRFNSRATGCIVIPSSATSSPSCDCCCDLYPSKSTATAAAATAFDDNYPLRKTPQEHSSLDDDGVVIN